MSNAIAMPRWMCVSGEIQEIQKVCAVCLVYAPNSHKERLTVWNQLRAVKLKFGLPWIGMGISMKL